MAALGAPRRELGAAEGRSQEHALLAEDPILANQAKTAAEFARTCIHRIERVLLDDDSVLLLGDLCRDDVRLPVTDANQPGFAILVHTSTPATCLWLDEDRQLPVSEWVPEKMNPQVERKWPAVTLSDMCGASAFQTRSDELSTVSQ